MNFINPYELLEIETFDTDIIRKAKRKKLTDFDLSDDGMIYFKNNKIHKADFLKITDELDNVQKSQFYWAIKKVPDLNSFLSSGDSWFFISFQSQSIYDNALFIDFISPFFASQYNNLVFNTYQSNDNTLLKKLVRAPFLVNPSFIDQAYQRLRKHLKEQITTLNQIRIDIDNESIEYKEEAPNKVFENLQGLINIPLLNTLPSYFQSQRNDIGQQLRNISVSIFNHLDNSHIALNIIQFALSLEINSLTKQNIENDLQQIRQIHQEREEAKKHAPVLLKYALALRELRSLIDNLKFDNQIETLLDKVNSLINIEELNLRPSVFDEVRGQIALVMVSLSVEAFNEHRNIDVATSLIEHAQQLETSNQQVIYKVKEAANSLEEIVTNQTKHQNEELGQLIELVSNINLQITLHGIASMNQEKINELLNNIFSNKNLMQIAAYTDPLYKKKLVVQLLTLCESISSTYAIPFLSRLKGITKNNYSLHLLIDQALRKIEAARHASYHNIRQTTSTVNTKSEGCYIATACYKDYNAPEVRVFRRYRDQVLANSSLGRWFISFYYRYSPFWANKLSHCPQINVFIKKFILNPIYNTLKNEDL